MKAELWDENGTRRGRARPYLVLLPTVLALAVLGGLLGTWSPFVAFLALGAPAVAALRRLRGGTRAEQVELALGPGHVEVRAPARLAQRFGAREVLGASTAATPEGEVLVTLALEGRRTPTTFRLASEAQAEELRRALGIGHGGVGRLAWHMARAHGAWAGPVGRAVLAVLGVAYAALFATSSLELAVMVLGVTSQVLVIAIAAVMTDMFPHLLGRPPAAIEMSAEGVRVQASYGPVTMPYAAIQDVRIEARQVVFVDVAGREVETPRTRRGSGMGDDAARAMRAQIVGAAARARGFGRPKQELAQRLEQLRRDPRRESPRDWLVRLEAAGRMLSAGPGYRGQAMDPEDLWTALEDPEADDEIRAAAARVLRSAGAPEARVRIDAAMAATRDPATQERLRIALAEEEPGPEDLEVLGAASALQGSWPPK